MSDSIQEALTKAFSEAEKDPKDALETPAAIGTDEPGDAEPIGGGGDEPITDSGTDAADADTSAAGADPATPSAPAPVATPETPVPASWSKEEREAWSTVPEQARKAIARREGEMQRAFQTNAVAKRRLADIDRSVEQYRPLLDRYNVSLEQVLPPLLATRAALEVGTDAQKATLVANMCGDFGISVDALIEAWNTRFGEGAPPPQRIQPPAPAAPMDPRLANLLDQIDAGKSERAAAALAPITALPNYDAVRFTMADLIEKARDVGQQLPLDKAHTLACQLHGFEVAASAPAVTASQAASILARSRNAASSVSGAPQPTPPRKPGEGSVADEVSALMNAGRR